MAKFSKKHKIWTFFHYLKIIWFQQRCDSATKERHSTHRELKQKISLSKGRPPPIYPTQGPGLRPQKLRLVQWKHICTNINKHFTPHTSKYTNYQPFLYFLEKSYFNFKAIYKVYINVYLCAYILFGELFKVNDRLHITLLTVACIS